MAGIQQVTKSVKVYCKIDGLAADTFMIRLSIMTENDTPLFADLEAMKKDILIRLPSAVSLKVDASKIDVFADAEETQNLKTSEDLVQVLTKAGQGISRLKFYAKLVTSKDASAPPAEVAPLIPAVEEKKVDPVITPPKENTPALIASIEPIVPVESKSVGEEPKPSVGVQVGDSILISDFKSNGSQTNDAPALLTASGRLPRRSSGSKSIGGAGMLTKAPSVDSLQQNIVTMSKVLADVTKERDDCLLYVQMVKTENDQLAKELALVKQKLANVTAETKESTSASAPANEQWSTFMTVLESQQQSYQKSLAVLTERHEQVLNLLQTISLITDRNFQFSQELTSSVKDVSSAVKKLESEGQSRDKRLDVLSDEMHALTQHVSLQFADFAKKSSQDEEKRMHHLLAKSKGQMETIIAPLQEDVKALSVKLQTREVPVVKVEPLPKENLVDSKSNLAPNPASPLHTSDNESVPQSTSPTSNKPIVEDYEDDEEEFEDPVDGGFILSSHPKPVDQKTDLQQSLTESQTLYPKELDLLKKRGYGNTSLNALLLGMHKGNVEKVIEELDKLNAKSIQ